jgi:hypothetical protein
MSDVHDRNPARRRPITGGVNIADNLFVVFRDVHLNVDDDKRLVFHTLAPHKSFTILL